MRLKGSTFAAVNCLLLIGSLNARADEVRRTDQTKVTFNAVGPGGLRIQGVTADLEFRDSGNFITIVVPLKNLSTGIDLRDRHMKEKYLEVDKHPNATLVIEKATLKFPKPGERLKQSCSGTLEVHGVKKSVSIGSEVDNTDRGILVAGNFHMNLKEHQIEVPTYLGVTVKPDMTVGATFRLEP